MGILLPQDLRTPEGLAQLETAIRDYKVADIGTYRALAWLDKGRPKLIAEIMALYDELNAHVTVERELIKVVRETWEERATLLKALKDECINSEGGKCTRGRRPQDGACIYRSCCNVPDELQEVHTGLDVPAKVTLNGQAV